MKLMRQLSLASVIFICPVAAHAESLFGFTFGNDTQNIQVSNKQSHGSKHRRFRHYQPNVVQSVETVPSDGSVLDEAKKYVGRNPTGKRSQWCKAFVNFVLRRNGLAASSSQRAIDPVPGHVTHHPVIGSVARMAHHTGFVAGIKGNKVYVLSGNYGNTTGYGWYSASQIIDYRVPTSHLRFARN